MAFSEQQQQEDQAKQGSGPGVGALLKASRLRIGEDLRDISEVLCIRHVYLEAMEDGRFEALPGPTYAIGFVRAYAEHLGLDSDEVVRRFKAHPSGGEEKAELTFPEPIPEPGIPGGAIVFIGILISVVAYGAWYVNTSKDGFLVELISPVPERLAALGPGRKEQAADPGTPAAPIPDPAETPSVGETKSEAETSSPEAAPEAQTTTVATPEAPAGRDAEPEAQTTAEASPEAPAVRDAEPEVLTTTQPPDPQEAAWDSVAAAVRSSAAGGAAPAVRETGPETQTTARAEPEPNAEAAPVEPAATTTATTGQPPEARETPAARPSPIREPVAEPAVTPEPAAAVEPPRAPSIVPEDVIPEAPGSAQGSARQPADTPPGTPEPSPALETVSKPASPAAPVSPAGPATDGPASAEQAAVPSAATGGDENRIVVRAMTNSWIQVRDDIGKELLVTRLLRAGDSYAVPNRPGLKLSTGNAGALEILVDGKAVPSIGKEGTVRRGVALDADKLKAGTAVSE